ncbi:MAG: glycosyltransferase [Planctomycetota bacterium]
MKLLFLTQWLDRGDAVLGFVPRWLEGLAGEVERLRVIALWSGDVDGLPDNVDVRTVGRTGRVGRFLRYRRVLSEAFADGFDVVLAHMVPRYALLAAGQARRAGAPVYLWYTHKGVDGRLRRAERIVEKVFTASEASLRLETPKRVVTGHGIDLAHFALADQRPAMPPRLLAVGRLTPAKDPLTLFAALSILVSRGYDLHLDWAGGGLAAADASFARTVSEQLEVGGLVERVTLHGDVPYRDVPSLYKRASVLCSTSLTGSVDKVVLEAMACGRPVVTCNESFAPIFAELGPRAEWLGFEPGNADQLADRIEFLLRLQQLDRSELALRMRAIVERDHEVDRLMARLVREMGGGPGERGA